MIIYFYNHLPKHPLFRTESVAESVLKNPYPVPKNLPDKDIRFRTEHPDMVQDMVWKIASEYELSEY